MELFSIRIQRTFQLVSTELIGFSLCIVRNKISVIVDFCNISVSLDEKFPPALKIIINGRENYSLPLFPYTIVTITYLFWLIFKRHE